MTKLVPGSKDLDEDLGTAEEEFKPLTREEAEKLRRVTPVLSLWRVVLAQVGVGCMVAALAWLLTGRASVV